MTRTIAIFLLLLAGCAWKVDVPISRFETPETSGKLLRVHLEGAYGAASSVVLSDNFATTPPNTRDPKFGTTKAIWLGGGIGLNESIDLVVRSTPAAQLKFQLLGKPRSTADGGNFSLAVVAGAIGGINESSALPLFGPYSSVVADLKHLSLDGSLVAGLRAHRWLLFYTGGFVRRTWYSGTYQPTERGSGTTTTTAIAGNIDTLGGTAGVEIGPPALRGMLEGSFGRTTSGSLDVKIFYFGAAAASDFNLF